MKYYTDAVCLCLTVSVDIMMARGIVRECVQDVDRLAAVASSSSN